MKIEIVGKVLSVGCGAIVIEKAGGELQTIGVEREAEQLFGAYLYQHVRLSLDVEVNVVEEP